ncbi:DUF6486 family protein [Segatella copri]
MTAIATTLGVTSCMG